MAGISRTPGDLWCNIFTWKGGQIGLILKNHCNPFFYLELTNNKIDAARVVQDVL